MRAALVSLVALTIAACAAQAPETSAASTSNLATADMADAATVLPDRLVFPHALVSTSLRGQIEEGAQPILLGGRASNAIGADGQIDPKSANPNGFARRALSFTDDGATTTVMTTPVSMEEAFQSLDGSTTPVASPQFQHTTNISVPVIDLSNQQLWSDGTASLQLKTGSLTLNTSVDVGTDIDWYKLGQAHVILTPALDAELVLEAEYDGPLNLSISHSVYSGSWPVGSIGPVPVTLGLTATIACDLQADGTASVTGGMKVSASMTGGVSYDKNTGKSPVNSAPTLTASIITPQFSLSGNSTTTCHIRPQFSVLLFDAAGPTLTPDLAAKLDASNANGPIAASVTGELGLDVGGKLDLFGKDLGAVNYHLFTVDKQLWSTGE